MSSAGGVRAGKAYVEITADDTPFQRKMKTLANNVAGMGGAVNMAANKSRATSLMEGGGKMLAGGVAMGLPMVMAARNAATFEDALLELQGAVSGIKPDQLAAVRNESLRMSKALSVGPAQAAQAFTLLIKAGMSVEDALSGAAESAVQFAKVGQVDAPQAAEFMKVAMNVFGVSAAEAVDTLSAAADASETSIANMVEGFSQVGSVAKGTGQSLFGLSQAMAVMARYGMVGEEAGTGIKTVLTKLLAPTDEAKQALASMGLSMESFVDASGKLLPIAQIAGIFQKRLKGMSASARESMMANEALVKVFDVRGIKVIQAFADAGEEGFDRVATEMENARSVSEKYDIAMSGITGSFQSLSAAVQRLAISFATSVAPSLSMVTAVLVPLIDGFGWLLANVPLLSTVLATMAATLVTVGGGMMIAGGAASIISKTLEGIALYGPMVVAAFTRIAAAIKLVGLAVRASLITMGPVGWALLGLSAVAAGVTWMMTGSDSTPKAAGKKIKRDEERAAMAEAGVGVPAVGGGEVKRDIVGTFNGGVLGQLGIGPSLAAAQETASNTARMADSLDQIQQATTNAANTAGGVVAQASQPAATAGVANMDREMLSAQERAVAVLERIYAKMQTAPQGKGLAYT